MDFRAKNIWITGATSGIGREVAIELSKKRANLLLSGRNQEALKEVKGICESYGSRVRTIAFDLSNEKEVKQAAEQVLTGSEKIDALYHFGGISQRSLASETPLHVDRKLFEVNYFGTIHLTKYVLQHMLKNGGGHIAATSSIVGKFGFPYRSSYSASKHALHGYFESLLAENKANNIRVSMIIPGFISTNISVNAINHKGEAHGKFDKNQAQGMPADRCARKIVRGLQKEKKEILVGRRELTMVYIRRFIPPLYYYLAARVKPM